ncbi:MAG: aspartate carbamoyltransferase [Bacillus thermozeamaize]|jgi:aspartate carbamoyltransferase catalytic subunit|uniref:Aspartate carbamoyltransferase n=1 Tax=Bacillus thermozeamaize TaxID=230954 RepID=A0A1Y3PK15_9BACI|nr:MAG: aspartate carbamoyltransferase [Bacillus thermozeamaize]
MKRLISVSELTKDEVEAILERAAYRLEHPVGQSLAQTVVANLFFEPSTRTRFSFEMAVKRLGGETLNFQPATSSLEKGESLEDTVRTLEAMGVDAMVIRHAENGIMRRLSEVVQVPLINAGEGTSEHPTQCLLDLLTIQRAFGRLNGIQVALIGDVLHSRVAGSHLNLLPQLGMEIMLAGPSAWMPERLPAGVRLVSMERALQADVVMMLRVQKERMSEAELPDYSAYREAYGLTVERASRLKPHAIIMHPSPVNRGVEIDGEVVDHPQSRIFEQVRNGVAVRMAVLEFVIKRGLSTNVCHEAAGV